MKAFRPSSGSFAALGLAWLALLPADGIAQTNLILTGATYARNGAQAQAYILGQFESSVPAGSGLPVDLTKPEFSVYQKDGNPADPGNYHLAGVMRPVVDEATVSALLDRSWLLKPGTAAAAQEAALDDKLDALFGKLQASASSQTVAAKLGAVVAASLADPQYRDDLLLLGKTFPGVNICLGYAWAGPVTTAGPATFELRLRDAGGNDAAVTGRITIDASQATPPPLPAPGRAQNSGIEISSTAMPATAFAGFREGAGNEAKAQAGFQDFKEQMAGRKLNRAVRLRWSTPDALRQRSILQSGFNLWRIPSAGLPAQWLNAGPELNALVAAGAVKANTLPIVIPEDLSADQAAAPGDQHTNFYTDSLPDDALLPGAEGEFVYFVTAVDVLGRDGLVSPGTAVPICNRMPPAVVKDLQVINDYTWISGTGKQRFKLTWSASDPGPDGGAVEYEVFRWDRYDGAQRSIGATPFRTVSATTLTDDGAGCPTEANAHQTFWYTVRAVKVTDCGRFPAGHCGPVFGVIRDRKGPSILSSWIHRPCGALDLAAKPCIAYSQTDTTPGRMVQVTLSCIRLNAKVSWAEFSVDLGDDPGDETTLARLEFGNENVREHVLQFEAARFPVEGPALAKVRCRVGAVNGAISNYVSVSPPANYEAATQTLTFPFEANFDVTMVDGDSPCPQGGQAFPLFPLDGFVFTPGGVQADPDTAEVKYYRRVNDGPLSFIARKADGPASPFVESEFTDSNPPPLNGGKVCYYAQAFDSDGNAGAMKLLRCLVYPPLALPRPVLDRLVPSDPAAEPRTFRIKWTCPPVGVDRFKLFLSWNGAVPPADLGIETLQPNSAPEGEGGVPGQDGKRFGVYLTSRVEGRFSGESSDPPPADLPSEFTLDLPVDSGVEYTVAVKALGAPAHGSEEYQVTESEFSNVRVAKWSQEEANSPNVPWPDRPIPGKTQLTHLYLGPPLGVYSETYVLDNVVQAAQMNGSFNGLGVRIGQLVLPQTPESQENGAMLLRNVRINPNLGIFRSRNHIALDDPSPSSLFPCVLYRYRLKNPTDQGLSSDLVQVSPMMESIAYGFTNADGSANNAAGANTAIYDPFITFHNLEPVSGGIRFGVYLKDTLPVVHGATYRYLLVRFSPVTREPYDVIPVANAVTVP